MKKMLGAVPSIYIFLFKGLTSSALDWSFSSWTRKVPDLNWSTTHQHADQFMTAVLLSSMQSRQK